MRSSYFKLRGFSLIELMVVLSIISVLSMMGTKMSLTYKVRVAYRERDMNMRTIYALQTAFYANNNRYATVPYATGPTCTLIDPSFVHNCSDTSGNELGLRFTNCDKLRWSYLTYPDGMGANVYVQLYGAYIPGDGSYRCGMQPIIPDFACGGGGYEEIWYSFNNGKPQSAAFSTINDCFNNLGGL